MFNNNLSKSAERKCRCGRYISLGEIKAGLNHSGYECPECIGRRYSKPLTSEDYYNQFSRVLN